MTFYEAALRILEGEGRPLHVLEITQRSIAQSLLSHVGKTPETTMLSRLAAMARRTREKRVIVTAKDTFALAEWQLVEDADALALTGIIEENPEEALPPLRPVERHPEPRGENVKSAGRSDRKRRRDEDEDRGKKRRFPPIPEVVFELLSEPPGALTAAELLGRAKERELGSEELSTQQLLTALLEDNQRRIDAGRRPQFLFDKESQAVTLERAGSPSEAPPLALQAAFAEALGIPLEGGRPVLRGVPSPADLRETTELATTAKDAVKDARRAMARALRRRLTELPTGTFEKSVIKMLHHAHFRELKVAKRSKDGLLLTARRKEGSVELRFAVRLLRASTAVERRMVQELRRDLGHHSAQVGLLLGAGEVRGDARAEAQASGALVMLWCGDALAEKFFETRTGVQVTQVELYEVDEAFFENARVDAEESQRRRDERHKEREARGDRPRRDERERDEGAAALPSDGSPGALTPSASGAQESPEPQGETPSHARADAASIAELAGEEPDDGDEDEGDDELEAAADFVGAKGEGEAQGEGAAPGERPRRRRRRRGRRGRGARPGDPNAPRPPGSPEPGATAAAAEGAPETTSAPAPAPVESSPEPSSSGGDSSEPA